MADSSSRRRSPESSRRRRRERRAASRERTNATTADFAPSVVPAPSTNYYDASTPGPTMQDRSAPVDIARKQHGYRARPGSSSSGSSSTSSSLLDISRRYSGEHERGGVFQTFFRAPSSRLRRRRSGKKKKNKKVLYFGNSSSSSLNSDLAYGTGYIPWRKSSRDSSQRHQHQSSAPVAAAAAAGATYATMQNQGPLHPQGPSQYASSHGYSQSYSHPPPQNVASDSTSWNPGATAATAAAAGAAVGLAADYYNQDRSFPAKPAAPRRSKTDDEIMAIGRQLSDLAKAQNDDDLRAAGISKPSGLVSAATKYSDYKNSKYGTRSRGIGGSKIDSSSDDSDWESASDDDDSDDSADSNLAFGTVVSAAIRPTAAAAAGAAAGAAMAGSRGNSGRSAVDPRQFGPVNSLHGMVTPLPFDSNGKPISREPRPLTRSATEPMGPMRNVYPVATSDPTRFDATSGDLPRHARPGPVPLQQPTPRQTVSPKVYDAEKLEDATRKVDKSRRSEDSGWGGAAAAAGVAAGLVGAAIAKDRKEDKDSNRDEEKREKQSERGDKREKERDEKRKSKRDSYSSKYPDDKDRDKDREKEKDEKRKSKRDSYSSKQPEDKDRDKDRKRSSRHDDRDESKKSREIVPYESTRDSHKRRDEPDDGRSEISRISRRDSSKFNLPAKYNTPSEPRQLPRREKAGSYQATDPGPSKSAVDPFQYQVEDFAKAPSSDPPRPLTPNVFTVAREPVWDSTDDELPQGRLSRKDSFEIEQMVEENRKRRTPEEQRSAADYIASKAGHAVAPVGVAAMAGAIVAEGARSRDRKRDAYSDNGSEVRTRDAVQDEADKYYREAEAARKIASDRVRSCDHSSERSVVDKYQDDNVRDVPTIVTPPEYKNHEHKAEEHHADFKLDNRWTPSEAAKYTGILNQPVIDAERERPYLNLIYPTPASSRRPTPAIEQQEENSRSTDRDYKDESEKDRSSKKKSKKDRDDTSRSEVGSSKRRAKDRDERSSKSEVGVSSSRRRRTKDFEDETSKSDVGAVVVVGPDGEIQTPKSVSWGENRTDTFEVVTPEPREDREIGGKTRPALDKTSQWGAIATAIATNSHEPRNEPDYVESPKEIDSGSRSREMPVYHVEDTPPVPGPKPASPSPQQMPGTFADDIDFAATLAAGLEKTGFDANMVIDDPTYRRRDSPPGSNELNGNDLYQQPFSETVSDFHSREPQPNPSEPGFVLGEVETPRDSSRAVDPVDEFAEAPKLSKKERKKQEKLRKQQEAEAAFERPVEAPEPPVEEEPKLSKKEQRKRDKEAKERALTQDDEIYAEPEEMKEPETFEDAWEESSSKKKSRKSRDYYDDGGTSVSVPVEAYADLTSSRDADYDDDKKSRKSKRDSKSYDMSRSVDDLGLSQRDDEWDELKKSKKKSKRDSLYDSPSRSVTDLSKMVDPDNEDDKKSRRRSKRDSGAYDSPSRSAAASEAGSEVSRKSSKKSKRRSGTEDDFDDRPPDRGRDPFEERDVSSVVSEPRDEKRSSRRSYRYDDDDDAKSVASAPGGSRKKVSEKRSSGGLFSSIFKKDNQSKESFLDNAGILGAGVGLAGAVAAADSLSRHNATEALSEKKDPSEEIADWSRGVQDDLASGIAARTIKPAIDPQYGDLLPLPPSEPGTPVESPEEELPGLPESRPDTPPEEQSFRYAHARRKSAQETPVKSPSNTAIPFQLRLGNRSGPSSPAFHKSSPVASPIPESPGSTRKSRPTSWDDSHDYKPLYLVEHNRKGPQDDPLDSADLPALPPSEASSRSSPGPGSEAWESADEYAHGGYDQTGYDEPTLRLDTSIPAFQPGHDRAGSQDTTPKAEIKPEFPDMSGASEPDPIEPMSKDRSSYLLQSAPSSTKSNKTVDNDTVARNLQEVAETPSKLGNMDSLADLDESLTSADEHFSDAREGGDDRSPSRSRGLSDEVVTVPDTPADQSSADATPAAQELPEDLSMLTGKAKKKAKKAAKKKQEKSSTWEDSLPAAAGAAALAAGGTAAAVAATGDDKAGDDKMLHTAEEFVPKTTEDAQPDQPKELTERAIEPPAEETPQQLTDDDTPTDAAGDLTEVKAPAEAENDDSWMIGLSKSQIKRRKKQMEKEKEEAQAESLDNPAAEPEAKPSEEAVSDLASTEIPPPTEEAPEAEPAIAAEQDDSWMIGLSKSQIKKRKKQMEKEKEEASLGKPASDPEPATPEIPVPTEEAAEAETAPVAEQDDSWMIGLSKSQIKKRKKQMEKESNEAQSESLDKSATESEAQVFDEAAVDPKKAAEPVVEPTSDPAPEPATEEPEAWEVTGEKDNKKKKGKASLPEVDEPTPTGDLEAILLGDAPTQDKSFAVEETTEPTLAAGVPTDEKSILTDETTETLKAAAPLEDESAVKEAEPADDSFYAPPLSKKEKKKKQKKKAALQTDDSWIKEAEPDVPEAIAEPSAVETKKIEVAAEPAATEGLPQNSAEATKDEAPAPADEDLQAGEDSAPVSKKKKKKDKKKALALQLDTPDEPKLSDDKGLGSVEEPLTAIVATGDEASAWDQALEGKSPAPEIVEGGKDEDRSLQPEISEPLFSQEEPSAATTQDPSTQESDMLAAAQEVSEPAGSAWEPPSSKKSQKDKKKKKKQEQQEEEAAAKDEPETLSSESAHETEAEVPASWNISESQDPVEASYLDPIAEDEEVQADEYERRYRPEELDWDNYEQEAVPANPEDDGWDMDDDFFSKPTTKEEVTDDLGWDKSQTATDKDEPSEDEWSTLVTGKKAKKSKKKKALDLAQDQAADASASGGAAGSSQEQPAEDDRATPKKSNRKNKSASEEASDAERAASPHETQDDDALDAMQEGMSTPRPPSASTEATEIWQEAESQISESEQPSITTDDNDFLFPVKLSKKDKKKKKKQQVALRASAGDDKPTEASADTLDADSVAGATDDSPENTSGFVTPAESVSGEANPDDEWGGFSSKKSKTGKQKKKAKDSESEPQEPTADDNLEPVSQDRSLDVPDDGAAAGGSGEARPEQERDVGMSKERKKEKALAFDVSGETSPEATTETQLNEKDPAQYTHPADDEWTSKKDKKKKRKSVTFDLGETAPGDEKDKDVSEGQTEGDLPTSHQEPKDLVESEVQQGDVDGPGDILAQPTETEDQPAAEEVSEDAFAPPLSKKDKKRRKAEEAAAFEEKAVAEAPAAPEDQPAADAPTAKDSVANFDDGVEPTDESAQEAETAAEDQELADLEAKKAKKGRLVKKADRERYNELKAKSQQRAETKAAEEAAAPSEPEPVPSQEAAAESSRALSTDEPSTVEAATSVLEEFQPEETTTQEPDITAQDTPAEPAGSGLAAEPAPATEGDDSWMVGLTKSQIKKRKKQMEKERSAAASSETGLSEEVSGDQSRSTETGTEPSTPEDANTQTEETHIVEKPQTQETSSREHEATAEPSSPADGDSWMVGLSKSQIKKRKKQMEKEKEEAQAKGPQVEETPAEQAKFREPESGGVGAPAAEAADLEPTPEPAAEPDAEANEPERPSEPAAPAENDDSLIDGLTKSQIEKRKKHMEEEKAEREEAAEKQAQDVPAEHAETTREPAMVSEEAPSQGSDTVTSDVAEPAAETEPTPLGETDDSRMVGLTKSQIKKRKKAMAGAAAEPEEFKVASAPVHDEIAVAERALPSAVQPSEDKIPEDQPLDDTSIEDERSEDKPAEDKQHQEGTASSPPEDVSKGTGPAAIADPEKTSEYVDNDEFAGLSKKDKKKKKKEEAANAQDFDDWEPATEPAVEPAMASRQSPSDEVMSQTRTDLTPGDSTPDQFLVNAQETATDEKSLPIGEQPAESSAVEIEAPKIDEQLAESSTKDFPAQPVEDDGSWMIGLTKSQIKKRKKQMEKEKAEREVQEAAENMAQDTLAETQPTSDSFTPTDIESVPEPVERAIESTQDTEATPANADQPSNLTESHPETAPVEPERVEDTRAELPEAEEAKPTQLDNITDTASTAEDDSWMIGLSKSQIKKRKKQMDKEKEEVAAQPSLESQPESIGPAQPALDVEAADGPAKPAAEPTASDAPVTDDTPAAHPEEAAVDSANPNVIVAEDSPVKPKEAAADDEYASLSKKEKQKKKAKALAMEWDAPPEPQESLEEATATVRETPPAPNIPPEAAAEPETRAEPIPSQPRMDGAQDFAEAAEVAAEESELAELEAKKAKKGKLSKKKEKERYEALKEKAARRAEAAAAGPEPEEAVGWDVDLSKDKEMKNESVAQALENEVTEPEWTVPTRDVNEPTPPAQNVDEPTTAATQPAQPTIEPEAAAEMSQEPGPEPDVDAPTALAAEDEDEFAALSSKEKKKRKKAKALALAQAEAAKLVEPEPEAAPEEATAQAPVEPQEDPAEVAADEAELQALEEKKAKKGKLGRSADRLRYDELKERAERRAEAEAATGIDAQETPAEVEIEETPVEPEGDSAEIAAEEAELQALEEKKAKKGKLGKKADRARYDELRNRADKRSEAKATQEADTLETPVQAEVEETPETSEEPQAATAEPDYPVAEPEPAPKDPHEVETAEVLMESEAAAAPSYSESLETAQAGPSEVTEPSEPVPAVGDDFVGMSKKEKKKAMKAKKEQALSWDEPAESPPSEQPVDTQDVEATTTEPETTETSDIAPADVADPPLTEEDEYAGLSSKEKKRREKAKEKALAMAWEPEEDAATSTLQDAEGLKEPTSAAETVPEETLTDSPSAFVSSEHAKEEAKPAEVVAERAATDTQPLDNEWGFGLSKKEKKKKKKELEKAKLETTDWEAMEPTNEAQADAEPQALGKPADALDTSRASAEHEASQAEDLLKPSTEVVEDPPVNEEQVERALIPGTTAQTPLQQVADDDWDSGLSKKDKKKRKHQQKAQALGLDTAAPAEPTYDLDASEQPELSVVKSSEAPAPTIPEEPVQEAASTQPEEYKEVVEAAKDFTPIVPSDDSSPVAFAPPADSEAPQYEDEFAGLSKKEKKKRQKEKTRAMAMNWESAADTAPQITPAEPPAEWPPPQESEPIPQLAPTSEESTRDVGARSAEAPTEADPEEDNWLGLSKKDKKKKKKSKALDLGAWDKPESVQPETSAPNVPNESAIISEPPAPEDTGMVHAPAEETFEEPEDWPQTTKRSKKEKKEAAKAAALAAALAADTESTQDRSASSSSAERPTKDLLVAEDRPADEDTPADDNTLQPVGPSTESFEKQPSQDLKAHPASEPQPADDTDWGAVSTKRSKKDKKKKQQAVLDFGDPLAEAEERKDFHEQTTPAPAETFAQHEAPAQAHAAVVPESTEHAVADEKWAMSSRKSKKAKKLEASKRAMFEPQTQEDDSGTQAGLEQSPSADKSVEDIDQPLTSTGDVNIQDTPETKLSKVVDKDKTSTGVAEPRIEAAEADPEDLWATPSKKKSKKDKQKSKPSEELTTASNDVDLGQEHGLVELDRDNEGSATADRDVVMDEAKLDEAASLSRQPQTESLNVYQQSWDFPSGSQDAVMAEASKPKEAPITPERPSDNKPRSLDIGKAATVGAAAAGLAAVAENPTPGNKGKKGKKNKKSIDKRAPQEDDIFDDPSLWENADKKNLQEDEEEKAGDDLWGEGERTKGQLAAKENDDFWGGGADEDEVETEPAKDIGDFDAADEPKQLSSEPEEDPVEVAAEEEELQALEKKKAKKGKLARSADRRRYDELKERAARRAEAQPVEPARDYEDTSFAAQDAPRSLLAPTTRDSGAADKDQIKDLSITPQTESFSGSDGGWKETAQRGAPLDDYDNDDSPVLGRGEHATPRSQPAGLLRRGSDMDEPVGSLLREDSQAMALSGPLGSDFGGTRLSPARSLPGIQEVPEAEEATTTGGLPRTPDLNRDSGYVESPRSSFRSRSRSRSHLVAEARDQEQPRDSGYHDDEPPARSIETPKGHKKRSAYSTPKLQEPAAPELTPEPTKSSKARQSDYYEQSPLRSSTSRDLRDAPTLQSSDSRRDLQASPSLRSMRSRDYGDLRSESKKPSALPVASSTSQRSVSDNVAAPRPQESQPQLRRSQSNTSLSRRRTPDPLKLRPESPGIHGQGVRSTPTPPLRRVDKRVSGDLRSLRQQPSHPTLPGQTTPSPPDASSSQSQPVANEGRVRSKDMADVYDGFGEGRMGSPRSPTRPHSMRRRQSMQVLELESRVEQLMAENRLLTDARTHAEQNLSQRATSILTERDSEIEALKQSLQFLQKEVTRLTEVNEGLSSANAELAQKDNGRYADLEVRHADVARELDEARGAHNTFEQSLQDKDAEIADLRAQLEDAKEQVREAQRQILASKAGDSDFLDVLDEDHFDNRCQQLCSHVQQWVLRFSKFSDMRACRLTGEINDEKTIDRLDNAVLDGSDVDRYLSDRVKRRDIFMSMTMNMIWEFVFTRYLFGMDREQRQKLKSLEKMLTEVGPPQAVRQWRAVTLTLLARRDNFKQQKDQDTEAVVQAIFQTLCKILPPPSNLENQIQSQLRRVLREAVDLSIEMRTQKAEYMMLPPLQPEYDSEGELAATVQFNASMMNERSGKNASSNEDLEAEGAVVRVVLFPLVVKKGDDAGVGDEEIVVCPAQVVVASKGRRSFAPSSDAGGASLGGRSHMSVVTEHMV